MGSLFTDLSVILFLPVALSIFFWSLYNFLVFMVGITRHSGGRGKKDGHGRLPFISLIIPAKDEARVIGRLLESLLDVDYPRDRMEIVVVEDGSSDGTGDICLSYASRWPSLISHFHRPSSSGKPAALNFGLDRIRGEIVGVFDADSVPDRDVLRRVARCFEGSETVAIQGMTRSINAQENMLTRIASLEEQVWFKGILNGKDHLRLFVPLTGSCQFVRTDVTRELGGWTESSLAEDAELAARLLESNRRVEFCEDAVSLQETPSRLSQVFRQRARWYRGYIETAIKYGRLLTNPSRIRLDAELSLLGPVMLSISFLNYLLSWIVFTYSPSFLVETLAYLMAGLTSVLLLAVGIALVYMVSPKKLSNFLWFPFIYAYWFLQTVIAAYAISLIMLRRPRVWMKTRKDGSVHGNRVGHSAPT